jgi:hypothetical protein
MFMRTGSQRKWLELDERGNVSRTWNFDIHGGLRCEGKKPIIKNEEQIRARTKGHVYKNLLEAIDEVEWRETGAVRMAQRRRKQLQNLTQEQKQLLGRTHPQAASMIATEIAQEIQENAKTLWRIGAVNTAEEQERISKHVEGWVATLWTGVPE